MNKTALKEFAIYSRRKLMEDVRNKARMIGITEEKIEDPIPESTKDMLVFDIGDSRVNTIHGKDINKYNDLVKELKNREKESNYEAAYESIIEEVAYTWFNRIIAIRFMEVNNYMPDRMRILSSGREGVDEPEFITNYRSTNIGITEEEFIELDELKLDGNVKSMDQLFQFMFIKQCNALNDNLPELFEKTDGYMELLLNISYIEKNGVIRRLIEDIGEEAFDIRETGQIEIIGWLYQYYNSDIKEEVNNSREKINVDTLAPMTQIFTPEWIVKYMVQNSLGKLWIEKKISKGSNKSEKQLAEKYNWDYYLFGIEKATGQRIKLEKASEDIKKLELEEIKFIDPSMGSGHILVYAFDVFMELYLEEGYMERDAAESIIENNLYGLDIDKRAYQLAYFAIMMKYREFNRNALKKKTKLNLYYYVEIEDLDKNDLIYFVNKNNEHNKNKLDNEILELTYLFKNSREQGSLIKIKDEYNYKKLFEYISNIDRDKILPTDVFKIERTQRQLKNILKIARVLSYKYDVVVMNPPYLGIRRMEKTMKDRIAVNYGLYKYDMFSAFIENSLSLLKPKGYLGCMTSDVWIYIDSYKEFRKFIITNHFIESFIELKKGSFKDASVDIVTFILRKDAMHNKSIFINLDDIDFEIERLSNNINKVDYFIVDQNSFLNIPGYNFAYWIGKGTIDNFIKGKRLEEIGLPRQGMATTANDQFLRKWQEIDFTKFDRSKSEKYNIGYKWLPYNKGGGYRNWYGNNNTVINWENDGYEVKKLVESKYGTASRTIKNQKFYFKEGITYSFIGITISARKTNKGFLFDVAGSTVFLKNDKKFNYLISLLYSVVSDHYMKVLNPTINIQVGDIKEIPIIESLDNEYYINKLSSENIKISKQDWDSFETSWDFETSPLLDKEKQKGKAETIEQAYKNWKNYANTNFDKLKENEERLNELFIEIYGLEDELDKYVSDKDITICKIFDDKKDIYEDIKGNAYIKTREDIIKEFISFGVGCIFGRYSLDEKGLIYAGGEFDYSKYNKFKPVEDNIVIITDEEYFKDDLVNRFVKFVEVAFGEGNLEENLEFIADELKGKGTPREKIRNYFVNNFYDDHVKMYQKTPIYWQYDSSAGKTKRQSKNGFKALIYMHRYDEDTTGRVRIDHLHKVQRIYENRLERLKEILELEEISAKEKADINDKTEKLRGQLLETRDMDEKLGNLANRRIGIDLDDGVKINYEKVQMGLVEGEEKKLKILTKI